MIYIRNSRSCFSNGDHFILFKELYTFLEIRSVVLNLGKISHVMCQALEPVAAQGHWLALVREGHS